MVQFFTYEFLYFRKHCFTHTSRRSPSAGSACPPEIWGGFAALRRGLRLPYGGGGGGVCAFIPRRGCSTTPYGGLHPPDEGGGGGGPAYKPAPLPGGGEAVEVPISPDNMASFARLMCLRSHPANTPRGWGGGVVNSPPPSGTSPYSRGTSHKIS